jgi:hypothetical protein
VAAIAVAVFLACRTMSLASMQTCQQWHYAVLHCICAMFTQLLLFVHLHLCYNVCKPQVEIKYSTRRIIQEEDNSSVYHDMMLYGQSPTNGSSSSNSTNNSRQKSNSSSTSANGSTGSPKVCIHYL